MRFSPPIPLKPYTHAPGLPLLIPVSQVIVEIFPALIRFPFLSEDIFLLLDNPVTHFSVFSDWEKNRVIVSGQLHDFFFRYFLFFEGESLQLQIERAPPQGICFALKGGAVLGLRGQKIDLQILRKPVSSLKREFLSLGNYKSQDWEQIRRRADLTEILPLWLTIGRSIGENFPVTSGGTFDLLEECRKNLAENAHDQMERKWKQLFFSAFGGLLIPRVVDTDYWGIPSRPVADLEVSPWGLLTESAALIRSFFVREEENIIEILPHLPPLCHCGSFQGICLNQGILSIEWTKKTVRRLIFVSEEQQEICFSFRSNVRSFRLRSSLNKKGERKHCGDSILVEKNVSYFFDNFL